MICKKCSAELDDAWVACPYCGWLKPEPRRTKRGNGEGSIYKRNKTWTARVTSSTYVDEHGLHQKRPSKGGFPTRAAAAMYLSQLKADAPENKPSPTVAQYFSVFCQGKFRKLSKSKQTAYRIAYDKLEDVQHRPIGELTVGELQSLVDEKCTTYYPAKDVRVLLNHLFKLAAVEKQANAALPSLIELPPLKETEREPFTEAEQKLLWQSYEAGNTDAAMALIMIYTGMMTGELRKLQVSMIDWKSQTIVGVGLKTEVRRERPVVFPSVLVPVLEAVTANRVGRVYGISEDDFYARYYAALQTAGITRHLTPYSCRHTTATALAVDEHIAPQTIRRVMRWKTNRMLDRYAKPSTADALEAVERL